jgi:hypothetical protein
MRRYYHGLMRDSETIMINFESVVLGICLGYPMFYSIYWILSLIGNNCNSLHAQNLLIWCGQRLLVMVLPRVNKNI